MCPALPADREIPPRLLPLNLRGQSLRAGQDPAAGAVSERWWAVSESLSMFGVSLHFPGCRLRSRRALVSTPGRAGGARTGVGREKQYGTCLADLSLEVDLLLQKQRETQSCRLLVVNRDFGVAGAELIKG